MKRILVGAWVVGLVAASLGAATASANPATPSVPAQEYPSCGNVETTFGLNGGELPPGGTGELRLSGAFPEQEYSGVLRSHTRTAVGPTQSTADGRLTFAVQVPADFETQALHQLRVSRGTCFAGSFVFCVDADGNVGVSIPECQTQVLPAATERPSGGGVGGGGALAKTGSYLDDLLRLAALLIATGALVMYWRRRRQAAVAAA